MVILAVRETLCVEATTARSLVGTSIRVTTVVTTHQTQQKVLTYLSLNHLHLVRDVQDETSVVESAVLLMTPVVRGRVTVTALVMVIEDAKVTWYVVETTVRNMVHGTMRRMIVVRSLYLLQLVRDVQDVTMVDEGAALLITPVVRGRVTVTALLMVMKDAKVIWYVVEITARNMVHGTMRRMIVVRGLLTKNGVSGSPGHCVTLTVGSRVGLDIVMEPSVLVHSGIKTDLARFEETLTYSIPLPHLTLYVILT